METKSNRTVAMLTTWLDGWYQSQLWRGAVESARSHGVRLLTLVGYARPDVPMPAGPESILGLAARSQIDGVMLSSGPLSFWEGAHALEQIRGWIPQAATVSLGLDLKELDSVLPDGHGIDDIVSHFVKVHASRRIAFIGGPPQNPDAQRRFDDYKKALQKAGLPYDPAFVEIGGFYLEGGMQAMERLLNRGLRIDAVVAANDTMAIGAHRVLTSRGFRIPTDILISGYDDTQEGRTLLTPLSTVSNPMREIAFKGLELCLERISDPSATPCKLQIPTKVKIRKSCGCLGNIHDGIFERKDFPEDLYNEALQLLLDESALKRKDFLFWLQQNLAEARTSIESPIFHIVGALSDDSLKNNTANLDKHRVALLGQAMGMVTEARIAQLGNRLQLQESLIRDLHRTSNALHANPEPFAMVQNLADCTKDWIPDGMRLMMIHDDFSPSPPTDLSTVVFSYRVEIHRGQIIPIPAQEDLLPAKVIPGEIWTAVPLEESGMRFGIALFRNWDKDESFVEHLRLVLSTSFSISWRTRSEHRLRETLHRLAIRDEMTGLYNRRGLQEISAYLESQSLRENKPIAVFCVDMDHLKPINDTYGHAEGDMAIQALAKTLEACFRGSDVLARLGGDEFAVLALVQDSQDMAMLVARFRNLLREKSMSLGRPWELSASIGAVLSVSSNPLNVDQEVHRADRLLYHEKALKQGSKGEAL